MFLCPLPPQKQTGLQYFEQMAVHNTIRIQNMLQIMLELGKPLRNIRTHPHWGYPRITQTSLHHRCSMMQYKIYMYKPHLWYPTIRAAAVKLSNHEKQWLYEAWPRKARLYFYYLCTESNICTGYSHKDQHIWHPLQNSNYKHAYLKLVVLEGTFSY